MSSKIQNNKWKASFFTIAIGQSISLIGSSAVQFALIWWLASTTASPMVLSVAGIVAYLPQLLLGPFAGVWVDRLKRKMVIIVSDMFMGIVALGFSMYFLLGSPPVLSVYVVLGVRAIGQVFHTPAIQAAVPMIVPKEELVSANGLNQFLQSGSYLLGPVLGAAMFTAFPLWVILLSDLVGAIIACGSVALVRIVDPLRSSFEKTRLFSEMKEGAVTLYADKRIFTVTVTMILALVFYAPLASFYPLMTSDYFALSEWHLGVVNIGYALGMMLCALLLGSVIKVKRKFVTMHLGFFGMGLISLCCGLLPQKEVWFWVFVGLCLLLGACVNLNNIPYIAYLQETVAPERMGRVFSLIGSLSAAAMPLGLLIAGPVAEYRGVSFWFVLAGMVILILALISTVLVMKKVRT